MKGLIVFDLDGTIAASKAAIDSEMAGLLRDLLRILKVAVISGGSWEQFQRQVVSQLQPDSNLDKLSLLPTCGTKFYQYDGGWSLTYAEDLTDDEKNKIVSALHQVVDSLHFPTQQTWGEQVEDRGSQITFSALGQEAPLEAKAKWDPDFTKRKKMKVLLGPLIPEFSVRLGGTTSVDITRFGIDKAHGIRKLRDVLGIGIDDMLFVGDAIFPDGNDYPALEAGVTCIRVRDAKESKRVIETVLACYG